MKTILGALALGLSLLVPQFGIAQSPQPDGMRPLPPGAVILQNGAMLVVRSKAPATVTIEVSPTDIETGRSATITWSTTNAKPGAKPCTASGAWSGSKAASGSETVIPLQAGSYAYTLTCRAAQNGGSGSGTATLDVSDPTPPTPPATISIAVSPTSVQTGTAAQLTWSSANVAAGATPCTASGAWTGAKAGSGTESVSPAQAGSYSYALTCPALSGDPATGSASLEVTAPPLPDLVFTGPATATSNVPFPLVWKSNYQQCEASDGWGGIYGGSGTKQVTAGGPGDVTYTLGCGNSGTADVVKQVTVHVTDPPPAGTTSAAVTVANMTGGALQNYPISMGLGGIPGEFLNRPQAVVNGVPVPTQATLKNSWDKQSWRFGPIAFRIPDLPATGEMHVTFQDQAAATDTPLTAAELLAAYPKFDAVIELRRPATLIALADVDVSKGGVDTQLLNRLKAISDGMLAVNVDGTDYQIGPIDFTAQTNLDYAHGLIRTAVQAARLPFQYTGTIVAKEYIYGGETLTIKPPTSGTDLGPILFKTTIEQLAPKTVTTASARQMLTDGKCETWSTGPIMQSMRCRDDTAARAYDVGTWGTVKKSDGTTVDARPLRPFVYPVFWRDTDSIDLDIGVELGNTEELASQWYGVRVLIGTDKQEVLKQTGYEHILATSWIRSFHLGAPIKQEVNYGDALGHMIDAKLVPLGDPRVTVRDATLAAQWSWWQGISKILGAQGGWQQAQGTAGQRPDIGFMTGWVARYLYSIGDWRARQIAEGMAQLYVSFPGPIREGNPAKYMDKAQTLAGIGRPVMTPYARRTSWGMDTREPGNASDTYVFLQEMAHYWAWDLFYNNDWSTDLAHLPAPFAGTYVMTGKPWYLEQLQLWTVAATNSGAPGLCGWCRGPGAAIQGQVRGQAWGLRDVVWAHVLSPDTDPFKLVMVDVVRDATAWWEGSHQLAEADYLGTPMYEDGKKQKPGFYSPLHWFDQSVGYGTTNPDVYNEDTACSATAHWMNNWLIIAVAEAKRQGLPVDAWLRWMAQNIIWQATDPANNPWMQGQYVEANSMWVVDGTGKKTCVPIDTVANFKLSWAAGIRDIRDYRVIGYPGTVDAYFPHAAQAGAYVAEVLNMPTVWDSYDDIFNAMTLTTRPDGTAQKPVFYDWGYDPRYRSVPSSEWRNASPTIH